MFIHAFCKDDELTFVFKSHVYAQVYAQVQVLFKDDADLLSEFKDFLPAAGGAGGFPAPPSPSNFGVATGDAAWGADGVSDKRGAGRMDSSLAQLQPPAAQKRKKRPVEKEMVSAAPIAPVAVPKSGSTRVRLKVDFFLPTGGLIWHHGGRPRSSSTIITKLMHHLQLCILIPLVRIRL